MKKILGILAIACSLNVDAGELLISEKVMFETHSVELDVTKKGIKFCTYSIEDGAKTTKHFTYSDGKELIILGGGTYDESKTYTIDGLNNELHILHGHLIASPFLKSAFFDLNGELLVNAGLVADDYPAYNMFIAPEKVKKTYENCINHINNP